MTELAIQPNAAGLAQVEPAHREAAVTAYLEVARDKLAVAVEMTGPAAVAALKAEIATAAEATKQLGLSKEIQQDAQEMVRRAEYALGKAIRAGQERGEILAPGKNPYVGNQHGSVSGETVMPKSSTVSPTAFASQDELSGNRAGIYALTDGVTDTEFEAALSDAKSEGNVSRANVVRKVQGVKSDRLTPLEKLQAIRRLADTGMTSGQIATEIGSGEPYVRNVARQNGIKITADELLRGTHRLKVDSTRIVNETVMTLDALTSGIALINYDDLDDAQMQNWADSLTTSMTALKRFANKIKEKAQ